MDGFLVQQPFADLIANGKKTWELRTQPVYLPQKEFYILATSRPHTSAKNYDPSRLGVAVGVANFEGMEGPFTAEQLKSKFALHQTRPDLLTDYAKGRRLYAMKLKARPIEPRQFRYKQGAVTIITSVEFL
jgi:ASCH domain